MLTDLLAHIRGDEADCDLVWVFCDSAIMESRTFQRLLVWPVMVGCLELVEASGAATSALRPVEIRCEYTTNPMGVSAARPQLSWSLESSEPNQRQSRYQVLVATAPTMLERDKGDLWDSGEVKSGESVHVTYGGAPLKSRLRCYWKLRVWDESGRASDWSAPAFWVLAWVRPEDWQAQWFGSGPPREPRPPAGFFKSTSELASVPQKVVVDGRSTLLRKAFVAAKTIRQARIYVTGLGYYELWCNGRRVGENVLAPAKSNYRKWVLYDIYDLTAHLHAGSNVLGLVLGNGWFNPYPKWWEPYRMQWFGSKRGLAQLHIDYSDGSTEVIGSDGSWRSAPGPVTFSCVYDGEIYDATQEKEGWDRAGFDDSGWAAANVVEAPGGVLEPHLMPPIKVIEHLTPVALKNPRPGVYVFDLGQNFAGWARLTATGPRGKRITLRYAEDVHPNGMIDTTSNERATAKDVYVMKEKGREVYEPRFTFHGFRYVEVTGFPGVPTVENLLGCVVHSACEQTGSFECSNELVNRIHRATRWSQRSNLMGYPMDCPQRDERLGWFGDAMVSMEEAMCNFDLPVFYRHWLNGVRFNQNEASGDISIVSPRPYMTEEPDPTWSSAYVVMVWNYFVHYGDRQFLAAHFDAMKRYVDYLGSQATNHILPQYWIGDWGTIVKGWKEGEPKSVATACYYHDTVLLARAANVLGRQAEAQRYAEIAEQIKAAFNRAFYDRKKRQYEKGTQFSNAFPLILGLAEPSERPGLLKKILDDLEHSQGHFNVGVLGAKYLIDALTENGKADVAYQLVNQKGYPGWAHMLEGGRTTLSEFWDLRGSHNHVMMGSIDGWFYRTLAGIQPDEEHPGFEHVVIRPFIPDSLTFVRASVKTVRGRVAVDWEKADGTLRLKVGIPGNSRATVYVPAPLSKEVRADPPVKPTRFESGYAVFEVGSGPHEFRAAQAKSL